MDETAQITHTQKHIIQACTRKMILDATHCLSNSYHKLYPVVCLAVWYGVIALKCAMQAGNKNKISNTH